MAEPAQEIYGKTMSIPDTLTENDVRLVSGVNPAGQAAVLAMKPRDAKAALAGQLVKRLHGEEAARLAEEDFDLKFRRHEIPGEIEVCAVSNPKDLVAVLVESGLRASRGDASLIYSEGGERISGP